LRHWDRLAQSQRVTDSGDLLIAAPAPGAATVALQWLAAARAAAERLARADDDEALHDFRVALRRLRSTLRLYRPELGRSVAARMRRSVKKMARATNAARDTEVQLAWLQGARLRLTAPERLARSWWGNRLTERRDQGYQSVRDRTLATFRTTAPLLERALVRVVSGGSNRDVGGFARVTGERLQTTAQALGVALGKIRTVTDTAEIHAARIAGKRLRYLLEPVAPALPGGRAAIRQMKRFQDEFGLLNDTFVRLAEIEDAVRAAGAEQARVALLAALDGRTTKPKAEDNVRGLVGIGRIVQRDARRRFRAVARDYLGSGGDRFVRALSRLGVQLMKQQGSRPGQEPTP
jgi:CHAD domain-containing protein